MLDCRAQQLIGGEWRDAADAAVADVLDPATEQPIAQMPFGGRTDAEQAIEAAAEARHAWAGRTAYQRADVLRGAAARLRERRDRLGAITTAESGKPLAESKGEWSVAADLFDWFAEEAKRGYGRVIPAKLPGRHLMTLKRPIGVVGVVTAWNFPAYNPARSVAAALAAGCPVVCRPADETPLSGVALAEALVDAGVPPSVFNLISGDPAPMADAMLADPRVRKLSFTGSTEVGKRLIRGSADTVTSLALELGGNAPVIVEADVAGGAASLARSAVTARFRNCGQVCIAPQRFFVHRDIYDEFLGAAAPLVAAVRVGPGAEPTTEVGPLINVAQRDRVEQLLASDHGGRVLAGGERPAGFDRGYFFRPTLVADVDEGSRLWREETFGPVLAVRPYDHLDEAIASANRLESGLAAYVWASDLRRVVRAYEGLEYGMVGVNGWTPHGTETPFPGWKQSGLGAEGGAEGLDEYLETKVVSFNDLGL